jgi:shikimate dehydrogenase
MRHPDNKGSRQAPGCQGGTVLASDEKISRVLSDFDAANAATVSDGRPLVLAGLVGRAVQASRTPAMHEKEGARLGLRYRYLLVDFDSAGLPDDALGDVVRASERRGFSGLNVTHPFKHAITSHVTNLSPEATAIGAINTVIFEQGRRTGHNTDVSGFADSFRAGLSGSASASVALFGAGGAGAAVAYALKDNGVRELLILDPDTARASDLAQRIGERFGGAVRATQDVEDCLARADGIVNATPIGMVKYPGLPFPAQLLQPRHWVAEVIYFPIETDLVRTARALGCRTLTGTGMAVGQAVRAFELFTGLSADWSFMEKHFDAA